jgi:hypothetical protein
MVRFNETSVVNPGTKNVNDYRRCVLTSFVFFWWDKNADNRLERRNVMGFLDFIKDHNASPQPFAVKKTLENARELLKHEAAPQKAQLTAEQIPEEDKAAVKGLEERIGRAQPANAQQQTPESAAQASRDRILETLERAQGSKLSPTPDRTKDGIDPAKLARAERFVDASARPKRQEPPPMRWPRPVGSWER